MDHFIKDPMLGFIIVCYAIRRSNRVKLFRVINVLIIYDIILLHISYIPFPPEHSYQH